MGKDILTISDVHLGNRNTPSEFILNNLTKFFGDFGIKDNFPDLKVIFFAGDLWDDSIQMSSSTVSGFFHFWSRFTRWCHRKQITVRILEGTPKHDRRQGETIASFTQIVCPELDFRYVNKLSIEHMACIGTSVLYVPDEWRPTADQCYQDVIDLMAEEKLSSVGIGIMHGMFAYQLGTIPMNAKVHKEELYLNLVEHFVSVGHIHTRSQYERIFAQGSFDRIAHGEPLAKGAWYFKANPEKGWTPIFMENKTAKIYETVTVDGDLGKALKKIDKAIKDLPNGSYVRIVAPAGHEVFQAMDGFLAKYPFLYFSRKAGKAEIEAEVVSEAPSFRVMNLNRQTLNEAIFGEVIARHDLSPEQSKRLNAILEELHT